MICFHYFMIFTIEIIHKRSIDKKKGHFGGSGHSQFFLSVYDI